MDQQSPKNFFPQGFDRKYFFVLIILFFCAATFIWLRYFSWSEKLGVVRGDTQRIQQFESKTTVKISDNVLNVDLATTGTARRQGLSGRQSLGMDEGMLFVFEVPAKYDFWMKDMLFPIDIIWIDEQKSIVHIESNVLPESFPKVFTPNQNAKFVLETRADYATQKGIKVGDQVEFFWR